MQRDGTALPLVGDLDFQSEDIAELAFKRSDVGIDLCSLVRRGLAGSALLYRTGARFGLPYGKALRDNFLG